MRYRLPIIRRPLGTILILSATAGVAYKFGREEAQQIQNYTGYPPDELSENDLKDAMRELNIESKPLDNEDRQELKKAQTSSKFSSTQPAECQSDYLEELQKLAELRDAGIISDTEFEMKKQQLLGI